MDKGKFIVFEGLDGAGKSTQMNMLAKRLKFEGYQVHKTAEPTSSVVGGIIRDSLEGHHKRSLSELAALFLTDRIIHNTNPVSGFQNFLEQGMVVLSDRYYYSSFAYQSDERNAQWVMDINLNCDSVIKPDLCIFLDIDPHRCSQRISNERAYSEIFENIDTLILTREKFFAVFDKLKDSENIKIVDASGAKEQTAQKIWDIVSEELHIK